MTPKDIYNQYILLSEVYIKQKYTQPALLANRDLYLFRPSSIQHTPTTMRLADVLPAHRVRQSNYSSAIGKSGIIFFPTSIPLSGPCRELKLVGGKLESCREKPFFDICGLAFASTFRIY